MPAESDDHRPADTGKTPAVNPPSGEPESRMLALSGASGLIGRHLRPLLAKRGWRVCRLVRDRTQATGEHVYWCPTTGEFDAERLEGFAAVVHLAGENIASGRWSPARKRALRDSRVAGTSLLCGGLARLRQPPKVLVAASAVGYYGDRAEEVLTEASPAGSGFLAELVRDWEAAAEPAREAGIRVVHLRIGLVLTAAGGALARMLTPFRLGLGGRVGSGRQYMSWIALADLLAGIVHALEVVELSGPVNATAPTPVTNAEFARTLARVLHRPALLPLPGWAVRLLLGEMGRELLLVSVRARPEKLAATGFVFAYPRLEDALRAELRRAGG